jgi:hypothetical protein
MAGEYFSDRENGPKPRIIEEISPTVWGGIYAIVSKRINDASFGNSFPKTCFHGPICGCDNKLFINTLKAEIPEIHWPLSAEKTPHLLIILDFIEFCHKYIAKPRIDEYHSLEHHNAINAISALGRWRGIFSDEPEPGHNHFSYSIEQGQREFRDAINLIFARNGIVYELTDKGTVIRLAPEILRELLQNAKFHTGDDELDTLLNTARSKFLTPRIDARKESLEKLWDAWERLKTIEPGDKKTSISVLLKKSSPEPGFRKRIDDEALELTEIGNKFRIRHSEVDKIQIESSDQVDYLFHRLFALVYLLLKATNRIK